jgi:hypothetical protein
MTWMRLVGEGLRKGNRQAVTNLPKRLVFVSSISQCYCGNQSKKSRVLGPTLSYISCMSFLMSGKRGEMVHHLTVGVWLGVTYNCDHFYF